MLGMEFEPNKHKEAALSNVTVILGVEVHLQDFLSECKVGHAIDKKLSSTINKILIDKL